MRKMIYQASQMCIVMYSVTDSESFSKIEKFIEGVNNARAEKATHTVAWPFLIIGNKNDLQNELQVSQEHAKELERRLNIPVIEGSCLETESVLDAVLQIVRMTLKIDGYQQNLHNSNSRRCNIM
jgi:GTPase SAR1 family protein